MKLSRSKKAVSNVIATLLMINIAIATGVLVYVWAQGLFSTWGASTEMFFQQRSEKMDEIIAIENLRFENNTNYKFNITIRNAGQRELWVDGLYLNNTNVITLVDLAWNSEGNVITTETEGIHKQTYLLPVGNSLTLAFMNISYPSIDQGDILHVIVTTDRGNRIIQEWEVTG